MVKLIVIASVALAVLVADVTCQRYVLPTLRTPTKYYPTIIQPTYRPPVTRGPIIRTVREARDDEPLWLWNGDDIDRAPATGDHPVLPSVIDDINLDSNTRHVRSVDSPSARRHGGHSSSSGSRDTGATHPGYNRRNARSIAPLDFDPFRPTMPKPYNPFRPRPGHPRGPYPIYARTVRDLHIPGLKKPSHRDVIIPNWNPNVRTQPWQRIGGARKSRSVDQFDEEEIQ
ncbi:lebocin-4-like [Pectinophora gossypiella]|uniref:lebocin-4-like n=1 Tax=Pectinophora gossypiella TaxID=13191 RepID=UPI00214F0094|nr:lebocin-4-like [Pectinophora gossypiella]XP_049867706.1 lebocin-4-like [Pectinophora gossypiella]